MILATYENSSHLGDINDDIMGVKITPLWVFTLIKIHQYFHR